MPKTREVSFADASKALTEADANLQSAKTKDEKRVAALEFAAAHRDARLAKEAELRKNVEKALAGTLG